VNSPALKLNIIGRRRPGTTLAEHRYYIRNVHGELVLRYIRTDPENAPRRYVQNPVHDDLYRSTMPSNTPLALGCDFVTQVWASDFEALARSRQTDFYKMHLRDDEDLFVDQSSVIFLPSHEREIASSGSLATGAWKLLVLFKRAPGVDPVGFTEVWAKAASGVRAFTQRHVQNDVLGSPGADSPVDAIDEFWLDNEASAHVLLGTWQVVLNEHFFHPGLALPGSLTALIVREDVIHAGAI
jgi:vanillate O-demethylase ferredoxin subunit